ncbi:MAG: tyrosine-type recombinase/integrase [Thermodesulfobacteriota bacterium]
MGKQRVDPKRWPGVYFYQGRDAYNGKSDLCYYITYKVDRKKIWEKIGWKSEGYTPQAAAEIRAEKVKDARHGKEVKTQKEIRKEEAKRNKPINKIADAYLEAKGPSMKGRGAKIDRYRFDKHVAPVVGEKSVSELSQLDLARITKNMSGMSTSSKWAALEILRRVINFGIKHQMCKPPSFKIELPRKNNAVTEYLDPDQVKRLFDVLETWPSRDVARMVKLAFFTGMRRGEIFALQNEDVDFRQDLIFLRGADREGPKGGKMVSIPMNKPVKELLQRQIKWRDERFPGSQYLFPGLGGELRTHCSAVGRIKEKAGLPASFRIFHGLRHHFGVTLANSGEFGLDMIGELLTHKSPQMTKRYAQYLPDTMKTASARASELLQVKDLEEEPAKVVNIDQATGKG